MNHCAATQNPSRNASTIKWRPIQTCSSGHWPGMAGYMVCQTIGLRLCARAPTICLVCLQQFSAETISPPPPPRFIEFSYYTQFLTLIKVLFWDQASAHTVIYTIIKENLFRLLFQTLSRRVHQSGPKPPVKKVHNSRKRKGPPRFWTVQVCESKAILVLLICGCKGLTLHRVTILFLGMRHSRHWYC